MPDERLATDWRADRPEQVDTCKSRLTLLLSRSLTSVSLLLDRDLHSGTRTEKRDKPTTREKRCIYFSYTLRERERMYIKVFYIFVEYILQNTAAFKTVPPNSSLAPCTFASFILSLSLLKQRGGKFLSHIHLYFYTLKLTDADADCVLYFIEESEIVAC